MPVITYLRNPALKQRHWLKVEIILNYKFQIEEPVTLRLLDDIGVFTVTEELQEISGQASSEAGLEALLRKASSCFHSFKSYIFTQIIYYFS